MKIEKLRDSLKHIQAELDQLSEVDFKKQLEKHHDSDVVNMLLETGALEVGGIEAQANAITATESFIDSTIYFPKAALEVANHETEKAIQLSKYYFDTINSFDYSAAIRAIQGVDFSSLKYAIGSVAYSSSSFSKAISAIDTNIISRVANVLNSQIEKTLNAMDSIYGSILFAQDEKPNKKDRTKINSKLQNTLPANNNFALAA